MTDSTPATAANDYRPDRDRHLRDQRDRERALIGAYNTGWQAALLAVARSMVTGEPVPGRPR